MARDVNRRIIANDEALPRFARASQNIAIVAVLLHGLPEAATPEDRWAHHKIHNLLERAAAQQAESLLSRRHELDASQCTPSERPDRDASVHQEPQGSRQHTTVPVRQRLSRNHDARNTLDARRCAYDDPREGARHSYHPCCGRRYDSGEDRSPRPGLPRPQAFGQHILNVAFPPRYQLPTNIPKYSGETNLGLWLEDYRLAYQAGSVDNDDFIIRNLPLFLADSARTWLEHLPSNRIQS
jgi:hypothetical protein